jgi:hypothetical protein
MICADSSGTLELDLILILFLQRLGDEIQAGPIFEAPAVPGCRGGG